MFNDLSNFFGNSKNKTEQEKKLLEKLETEHNAWLLWARLFDYDQEKIFAKIIGEQIKDTKTAFLSCGSTDLLVLQTRCILLQRLLDSYNGARAKVTELEIKIKNLKQEK